MQPWRTWQASQKNIQEKLSIWHAIFSVIFRCLRKSLKVIHTSVKNLLPVLVNLSLQLGWIKHILNYINSGKITDNSRVISCRKQEEKAASHRHSGFHWAFSVPGEWWPALQFQQVHYHSFIILNSHGVTLGSTSSLPFHYHHKLTRCYYTFNSTWTITFCSISIISNLILACTLWDPSEYLQSPHLCVRCVVYFFLKKRELSLTSLHMPVQTTTSFFLMTYKEYTQFRKWLYLFFMPKPKRNCSVSLSISFAIICCKKTVPLWEGPQSLIFFFPSVTTAFESG